MARTRLKNAGTLAFLKLAQWRGDPLASLLGRAVSARAAIDDPYPLYARLRRQELAKSMLGVFATANYEVSAAALRDDRFSSDPSHQRGYRVPEYADGDPRSALLGPETSLLTSGHWRWYRTMATPTPNARDEGRGRC